MLVNVGPAIGVAVYFIFQAVDVPKFRGGGMGVEEIVNAERRAPLVG